MSIDPRSIEGYKLLQETLREAAADPDKKKELTCDPHKVLEAKGLRLPAKAEVKVVHNTAEVVHLVVPSEVREWEEAGEKSRDTHLLLECGF